MRIFIGIEFNHVVKDYLSEVQGLISQQALKGNFSLYDNFHLTLRFLGELSQEDIDNYCDILDELGKVTESFKIKIGDINSFNRNNKHIVYVDVIENKDKMVALAKKLDNIIKKSLGVDRKDSFKPHITIAREVVFPTISGLEKIYPFSQDIVINQISIMLSKRDHQNVLRYTPIYTVML